MLKSDRSKILDLDKDRRHDLQQAFNENATPYIGYLIELACDDLKKKTNYDGFSPDEDLSVILGRQHPNRRYALPNKAF